MTSAPRAWKPAGRVIRHTIVATFSALLILAPSALAATGEISIGGCFRDLENTASGCTGAQGLDRGYGVAVSADGTSVYVAAADDDTLTSFRRDTATGALTWTGCWRDDQRSASGCASTPGLDGARGVAMSADDGNVYVASGEGDALAAFARGAGGALTPAGCLRDTESTVPGCTPAQGLDDPRDVAVSPDGKSVYLASATDDAVVTVARGAGGALTWRGCIRWSGNGAGGCATAAGMDGPRGVAVSPDGASVYVAARDGDAAVTYRRAADGSLTWVSCFRDAELAAGSCTSAQGLDNPHGVTVSPDGASVYFPSEIDDSVATFRRDGSSGVLTYTGCLRDAALAANGCTSVEGLDGARQVDVSPDNRSVYVAAADDDAVTTFTRDTGTGAITWAGCIRDTERGASGCSGTAQGLDGVRGVIVSGDGKSVYFASENDDAAIRFSRELAPPPPPPADTTAPTVGWNAPAAGATVAGTVACDVSAADDRGVARVDFLVDGVALSSDTAAPYACSWNTTTVSDGAHTLTAVAVDAAGNRAEAARSVTVSNAPPPPPPPPPPANKAPSVTLTTPTAGDTFSNLLLLQATASDDGGVVRVEWWIDGIRRVNDTAAPYRQNYSVPSSIGPGQHTVQARAYDAQGLVGLSQTVTVTRVKNNSSSTTYTATRTLSSKAKAKRSCRVSRKQVRRLSARSAAAKRRACRRAAANRRRS